MTFGMAPQAESGSSDLVMIVVVPVMVMDAIARRAAVGDSHFQGPVQAEGHDRVTWYPHCWPTNLKAAHGSDYLTHQAIVAR